MATPIATTRWNDLLNLFDTLSALHEQLLTLIRTKIEAMRKNDVPAMQDLTDQEHRLAGRIQDREGFRRQLMDSIGREAGWAAGAARVMPVSQLANHLPELQREVLLEKAGALRRIISRVADANRLAARISRGVLDHLHWVFAAVRSGEDRPVGYSGTGALVTQAKTTIFEAVG